MAEYLAVVLIYATRCQCKFEIKVDKRQESCRVNAGNVVLAKHLPTLLLHKSACCLDERIK